MAAILSRPPSPMPTMRYSRRRCSPEAKGFCFGITEPLPGLHRGGPPTFDNGLCYPPTMPSDCPVCGFTYSPVQMSDPGDAAFVMSRDGINNDPSPDGIDVGVYRYNRRTGVVPVMLPGMSAPDGGIFWGSWHFVSVPNNGEVYFTAWPAQLRRFPTPLWPVPRARGGWIYTSIHDFTGGTDGEWPEGGLAIDSNGNVYGTTYQGGLQNCADGC